MEKPLRRHEKGCPKKAQGTGKRECASQAICSRSHAGQSDPEGNRGGKMVGPARKREAVEHVRRSLAVSERRACQATGQPRSTQRYRLKRWEKYKALREAIVRHAGMKTRAGCRTVWRHLRRAGWEANHKRVHRIWMNEG